jgi:hypothetical protein
MNTLLNWAGLELELELDLWCDDAWELLATVIYSISMYGWYVIQDP